jgi:PAS domain-containing protein
MKTPSAIHAQIERDSERRAELWQQLARGHDTAVSAEIRNLDEQIAGLWEELRSVRATMRFGDRTRIVARARAEERLERAA